jgi:glycosyltransferase involved in cell wall biosynthesis
VADYAEALLSALRPLVDVEVGDGSADVCLYHLGNNALHAPIYRRALERPGLVVLHDAVLHHFLLGSLNETEYVREFVYNYGEWMEERARALWRRRARSASEAEYFAYPMLKRIAETSLGVVVHNPSAAGMVRAHVPQARIFEIPHLLLPMPEPDGWAVARLRRELGLAPSAFVFGVFGHLRESKRIPAVLRAFERIRDAAPACLLIAGEYVSPDLECALAGPLRQLGVMRTGRLDAEAFALHMSLADACINLRYPAAGETSGIAIRAMQLGRPVLLSRSQETERLPDSACVRVDTGPIEADMLTAMMFWLAAHPSDARHIGRYARDYVREHHAPERVASLYAAALSGCYHQQHS